MTLKFIYTRTMHQNKHVNEIIKQPFISLTTTGNILAFSKVSCACIYHILPSEAANITFYVTFNEWTCSKLLFFPDCQENGLWKLIHQLLQLWSPPSLSISLCPGFKLYHFSVHRSFFRLERVESAGELLTQQSRIQHEEEHIDKHIRHEKLKQNTMKAWCADYTLPQTDPVCGRAYKSL